MFYEPQKKNHGLSRDPFNSLVIPRPIGWITSMARDGGLNLAPFSHFNVCSSNPPDVMFGPGYKEKNEPKDSRINAEESGEFVVNIVSEQLVNQMNLSSAPVDYNIDEIEMVGLETLPSVKVNTPRIAQSPIQLECRYLQSVELPAEGTVKGGVIIFGRIVGIHIDETILTDGLIDVTKLRPVARLGYMDYTVIENSFAIERPKI
jgi:flavin reductase (DIM6/NTAB) family NADH-FMN oxidoreductase RutF